MQTVKRGGIIYRGVSNSAGSRPGRRGMLWSGRDADAEAAARQARLGERGLMRTRRVVTAVRVGLGSLVGAPPPAGAPAGRLQNRSPRAVNVWDRPTSE